MFVSVLLWRVCYLVALTRQGLISVLKDVKSDCIGILIKMRDCSIFYFFHNFLLKFSQVLKLSLNKPRPELVLLQLEIENYVQNKGKIDF